MRDRIDQFPEEYKRTTQLLLEVLSRVLAYVPSASTLQTSVQERVEKIKTDRGVLMFNK